MIGWAAFALGVLNLTVWVVVLILARKAWRMAQPALAMFGLGSPADVAPAAPPPESLSDDVLPATLSRWEREGR